MRRHITLWPLVVPALGVLLWLFFSSVHKYRRSSFHPRPQC